MIIRPATARRTADPRGVRRNNRVRAASPSSPGNRWRTVRRGSAGDGGETEQDGGRVPGFPAQAARSPATLTAGQFRQRVPTPTIVRPIRRPAGSCRPGTATHVFQGATGDGRGRRLRRQDRRCVHVSDGGGPGPAAWRQASDTRSSCSRNRSRSVGGSTDNTSAWSDTAISRTTSVLLLAGGQQSGCGRRVRRFRADAVPPSPRLPSVREGATVLGSLDMAVVRSRWVTPSGDPPGATAGR